MLKLGNKQSKKARKKLIDREWYRNGATHFGYISGLLTLIGLFYGIISYHQTVKPLVDEKKLKEQVAELEVQNDNLNDNILLLTETKTDLDKELSKLELKRRNLENELQSKEEQLIELQDEVYLANADAFMTPIIYDFLYNSAITGKNERRVKEETLEILTEHSKETSLTDSQKVTLDSLINFVNEKLNESSNYSELLGYRSYFYEQKLKSMGISIDE